MLLMWKNKNNSRWFVKPNVKKKAMNLLEVNTLESYAIFLGFLKNSEIEHGSKQLDYTKMKEFHKNSTLDGKTDEEIIYIITKLADKLKYICTKDFYYILH